MGWYKSLYLRYRFFIALGVVIVLFLVAAFAPFMRAFAQMSMWLFFLLCVIDLVLLYGTGGKIKSERNVTDKLSLADPNPVNILINSTYKFPGSVVVIDEQPIQFQARDMRWESTLDTAGDTSISYQITPYRRGEYHFGAIRTFFYNKIGFFRRRFTDNSPQMVKVYPGYLQLRKYRLAAMTHRLQDLGIKKIRRLGDTMEFEQIKKYVSGDDPRKINWKATARRGKLMSNQYQDERAQNVYCLIDKGRTMRMPFDNLSLLDHSINAALVLSHISIHKADKAGLITFSNKISSVVKASKRSRQMHDILETLYNQRTYFKESNYELLYNLVKNRVNQRSLMFLFTNWEAITSLRRQMKYLRAISAQHLLVVVIYKNTELDDLLRSQPRDMEGIYQQAIAEKMVYEKQQMAAELRSYGIHTILTRPENLTINAINKYLELKARGAV